MEGSGLETRQFYLQDAGYSTRYTLLPDATMGLACDYSPYGDIAAAGSHGGGGGLFLYQASIVSWTVPGMFHGYEWDLVSCMHHVRNRSLNIATGRWQQRDPLDQNVPAGGYQDGMNLYEYVRSQPVTWTDPKGLAIGERCCYTGNYNSWGTAKRKTVAWYIIPGFNKYANRTQYECHCELQCEDYNFVVYLPTVYFNTDRMRLERYDGYIGWERNPAGDRKKNGKKVHSILLADSYEDELKLARWEGEQVGEAIGRVAAASIQQSINNIKVQNPDSVVPPIEYTGVAEREAIIRTIRVATGDLAPEVMEKELNLLPPETLWATDHALKLAAYHAKCKEICATKKGQPE